MGAMKYSWHNRMNGFEKDGPFASIAKAKANAVAVYVEAQDGFAFDIVVKFGRRIVAKGFIKGGKWHDGEFTETPAERHKRLGEA